MLNTLYEIRKNIMDQIDFLTNSGFDPNECILNELERVNRQIRILQSAMES